MPEGLFFIIYFEEKFLLGEILILVTSRLMQPNLLCKFSPWANTSRLMQPNLLCKFSPWANTQVFKKKKKKANRIIKKY